MSDHEKSLEIKVGMFLIFGFGVLLAMIIHFGRLGEGFKSYYDLRVEFPNASGLLKGSTVLYGGAEIGRVSDHPRITNKPEKLDAAAGVIVTLKIEDGIRLPESSTFVVGSSGLLGDRFVDVIPPEKIDPSKTIAPGSLLAGTRTAGIDDISREGTEMIKDLRETITSIDNAVKRVNTGLFKDANMEAFDQTMQNLKEATGSFSATGEKLDGVVERANSAMKSAEEAMQTAGQAMETGEKAAEDIRVVIKEAGVAIASTKTLIDEAMTGRGALGRVISDPALSEDLQALMSNLRKHGVLFYRDSAGQPDAPEASSSSPARPSSPPRGGRNPGR